MPQQRQGMKRTFGVSQNVIPHSNWSLARYSRINAVQSWPTSWLVRVAIASRSRASAVSASSSAAFSLALASSAALILRAISSPFTFLQVISNPVTMLSATVRVSGTQAHETEAVARRALPARSCPSKEKNLPQAAAALSGHPRRVHALALDHAEPLRGRGLPAHVLLLPLPSPALPSAVRRAAAPWRHHRGLSHLQCAFVCTMR